MIPEPHAAAREGPVGRTTQRLELLSAVLLAAATIATAWSAYQSAVWNGEFNTHIASSTAAIVRVTKFSNLAMQRAHVHVMLFTEWLTARHRGDTKMAEFLLVRFPEPLKAATVAWEATGPFADTAPATTPFDMPEYDLPDRREADRWEEMASSESAAAERASGIANRYLLFTIIFACVLFFAGISGKFRWVAMDVAVLGLGGVAMLFGLVGVIASPRM